MIRRVFRDLMPAWLVRLNDRVGLLQSITIILLTAVVFLLAVAWTVQYLLRLLSLPGFMILMVLILLFLVIKLRPMIAIIRVKVAEVMNLLAVMETDIGDSLIQMEEELRGKYAAKGGLRLLGSDSIEKVYDKIVITPLIMDFGLKNYQKSASPYKVRWKPIVAQVEDLCLGIRDYYLHRGDYIKSQGDPVPPLFEIHPFMGVNTRNYNLKPPATGAPSLLEELLHRNFDGFQEDTTPEMRYRKLLARDWSEFNGNIESVGPYDFVGIKVYPPLGFNPWPVESWEENREEEMKKVRLLYEFCISRNIPLTAHCSPGGFLVDKSYREFASPDKWALVLREYPGLRLDLAHFGGAECDQWRDKVVDLILKYDNVYTDISYQGIDQKIYDKLKRFLDTFGDIERTRLMERIVFGTDFMISLQDIACYSSYLDYFAQAKGFTLAEKEWLCNRNAMNYLYLA
jgi:hypothetical protein